MSNPFQNIELPPPKQKAKPGRKPNPEIAARDLMIVEMRRNGDASLQEIADEHGISRQRVEQITSKAGIDNEAANVLYQKKKNDREFDKANAYMAGIIMQYIGGADASDIARGLGLQVKSVQEVIEENTDDAVIAARVKNQMRDRHPGRDPGPEVVNEVSMRRKWTRESVLAALKQYAVADGGLLPSSTVYGDRAKNDPALPSLATVRNRIGRWTAVKVEVHNAIRKENK